MPFECTHYGTPQGEIAGGRQAGASAAAAPATATTAILLHAHSPPQGNMDSGVLFGSKEMIEQRVRQSAREAKEAGVRHILNLGHGIMQVGG